MASPILSPDWAPSKELGADSLERIRYLSTLKKGAHLHISGVCGTGTASVLQLLKSSGFYVTGSDKAFYPPMGDVVRKLCDRVFEGYSAENLTAKPACVIIGNSLSKGNPEAQFVLEHDIPFASMPEVFAALLIKERDFCPVSIVVAGTHGKTTTTAAVATILDVAGRKPGYFIGGMPTNLPGSLRPVDTSIPMTERTVVLEGDEYDSAFFSKYSKFHSYRPDIVIVTSIEFDHADIYNSVEEIELEFTRLLRRVPKEGLILVASEGERLKNLVPVWRSDPQIVAEIRTYGLAPSDYQLVSREPAELSGANSDNHATSHAALGQLLTMSLPEVGSEIFKALTPLSGPHNAANLLAATAVAARCGVSLPEIAKGIATFTGALRRQTVIGEVRGITIVEDFAHHPTAVKVTLEGLKEAFKGRRLIAVFEPRSNTSRRAVFQEEYIKSFAAADVVMIQEVAEAGGYNNTANPVTTIDVSQIVSAINNSGKESYALKSVSEITDKLKQLCQRGDVVALMSNGDFGGLPQSLVANLA